MRKLISIITLVTLLVVFVLAGCGQQTKPAEPAKEETTKTEEPKKEEAKTEAAKTETANKKDPKDIVVGFCTPITTHPAWIPVKEGAEKAAKEGGYKVLWNGANMCEIPVMLETMETYIAQKVDGIVVYPLSASAFTPILQKCKDLGIPVVTFGGDAEKKELRLGFVGTDNEKAGRIHIEALHKKLGKDEMKVGIMMSNLDAANQIIQVKAAEDYLKNVKGAEIVDKRENGGGGDDAKTLDVISAMLKAHPEINCIMETDGGGPAIVGKVLDEMKLTDKVVAIGMDDMDRSLEAVKEGKIYGLMVQNFHKWGYLPTKYVFQAIMGGQVPDYTDSGVVLVTKENLDTYKEELYK